MFIERLPVEFEMEHAIKDPDTHSFWFGDLEKRRVDGYLSVKREINGVDVARSSGLTYNGYTFYLVIDYGLESLFGGFRVLSRSTVKEILKTPNFQIRLIASTYTFNLSPNK